MHLQTLIVCEIAAILSRKRLTDRVPVTQYMNEVITVSRNGLLPVQRQAITGTNDALLLISLLRISLSETVAKCKIFLS